MRQVCVTEMNVSELLMTCRNDSDDVESALCEERVINPAEI